MHIQGQFIESIHLIHVVFHKSHTCSIFCFIFTKGLYWSMLRGGACINYGVVWALHHCESQAPPTVPHKGRAECLNRATQCSCAHVNTWMTLSMGPAWICLLKISPCAASPRSRAIRPSHNTLYHLLRASLYGGITWSALHECSLLLNQTIRVKLLRRLTEDHFRIYNSCY